MKKLFLLLISAILFTQVTKAQQCACNPNGWQPGTAIIDKQSRAIKCGYQFSLKCTDEITIREEFKCTGKCAPKYNAVLKNTSTGAVVATYPTFTFPWSYHFTAAGNYSLEIQPVCGENKCTICKFYFTVTCAQQTSCDCNPAGWQKSTATIGTTAPVMVDCNHQFSVSKNQPFKLDGKYVCSGTCAVKYEAVLKNMISGTIVFDNTHFAYPWNYTFPIAGTYMLQIIPMCGDKKCTPCEFTFAVR